MWTGTNQITDDFLAQFLRRLRLAFESLETSGVVTYMPTDDDHKTRDRFRSVDEIYAVLPPGLGMGHCIVTDFEVYNVWRMRSTSLKICYCPQETHSRKWRNKAALIRQACVTAGLSVSDRIAVTENDASLMVYADQTAYREDSPIYIQLMRVLADIEETGAFVHRSQSLRTFQAQNVANIRASMDKYLFRGRPVWVLRDGQYEQLRARSRVWLDFVTIDDEAYAKFGEMVLRMRRACKYVYPDQYVVEVVVPSDQTADTGVMLQFTEAPRSAQH